MIPCLEPARINECPAYGRRAFFCVSISQCVFFTTNSVEDFK